MIRGKLTRDLEARVPLTIHGGSALRIDAVLDTGFTDYLCLARRHRRHMSLRRVAKEPFELADGRRVTLDVYLGEVTFDGIRQQVLVTLTDASDSLVGTALLRDKRVVLDFRRGTFALA